MYLEAMATEMPVIATRSGGPLDFVVDSGPRANGWFCEVDDVDSLAGALHQALTDEGEGRGRGPVPSKLEMPQDAGASPSFAMAISSSAARMAVSARLMSSSSRRPMQPMRNVGSMVTEPG